MELIDLRRNDGTLTGEVKERSLVHRGGDLHGTSHVWLVRYRPSKGSADVLLQKRSHDKDSFLRAIFRRGRIFWNRRFGSSKRSLESRLHRMNCIFCFPISDTMSRNFTEVFLKIMNTAGCIYMSVI